METQIFEQMPNERGTVLYSLQKRFQAMFGFTLPLFHGRGLLNCTSHLSDSDRIRTKMFRKIIWDCCLTEDASSPSVSAISGFFFEF